MYIGYIYDSQLTGLAAPAADWRPNATPFGDVALAPYPRATSTATALLPYAVAPAPPALEPAALAVSPHAVSISFAAVCEFPDTQPILKSGTSSKDSTPY